MSGKIYIKNLTGRTRTVCVNSEEELKNMTLKEFVRRFCPDEKELHLDMCRYIFGGKQLERDQTLGCYGIEHGSTIHIVQRLLGGGEGGLPRPPPEDEDEDEDKGMSRTESMDRLADMQQTEPESSSSCCIL